MKLLFSTLIFCCLTLSISAQNITLYGMRSTEAGQISVPIELVQLNPFTATINTLFEIDNSAAVAVGSSTYDHTNGTYIYWGPDSQQTYRIFSMGVNDETTLASPSTSEHPIELEFDLETGITYGIASGSSASKDIISVDLQDGSSQLVASLPEVSAIAIGSSTYDSNSKRYMFYGVDDSYNFRLYTVNVNTGLVEHSPIINEADKNGRINFFEYDNQRDILYGLYSEVDSSMYDPFTFMYYRKGYLAEIDLATGDYTVLSQTPILEGYFMGFQVGGVAYDQMSGTYILRGTNDSGYVLLTINSSDGSVVSSVASPGIVWELQVDNISFATTFYNPVSNEENELLENIEVYPNPVATDLTVEIEQTEYSNLNFEIRNILGQLVRNGTTKNNLNSNKIIISVQDLVEGDYVLVLKNDQEIIKPEKLIQLTK